MGHTFAKVLPLALGAAISPVILLLAVAVRAALAPAPDEPPAAPDDDAQASVHALRYFLLGVGAMVTNLTTIVLLIPATHDAATADLPADDRLLVMVAIALVTLLPAYGPLLAVAALGRRGPVVLATFGAWLRVHRRTVSVVVSLGFAAYLGVSGYVALT